MSNSSIKIGLVQINNSFSGQNYLPYSVACLQAYAQANANVPERFEFLLPLYKRTRISDAVNHLIDADVVGFSTYVWNAEASLEIARRLKDKRPDIMILFGGPHVPDNPENFLRENRQIDLAVHNEGEATFLEVIELLPERNWGDVLGVSYVDEADEFSKNPDRPRFRDLDEVPSPFLSGTLDLLIAANPNENWIGLWETNRGCPFQCTFCDWGSATASKVTKFELDRLKSEVNWFADHEIEYIFCCDANFGIQKRDVDIAEYVADTKSTRGYPHALSVQNTKNATERAYLTQKILSDAGLNKGVALSMQSVDQNSLEAIKRQNISLDTYLELQRRFTADRVETYSDLILGLPGETYDSFVEGVNLLIETGQHNRIQFNNLSILPNAEMGNPEYQKKYGMRTVRSEIINFHGERIQLEDDVSEYQDLVIETSSMPAEDWRRTRAFCWMTALLYFDKLFQIPMMAANRVSGISYRNIIEGFMDADSDQYPLISEIKEFFMSEAQSIQLGGPEYIYSENWLGIYWPADELVFIKLTAENNFEDFYREAGELLTEMVSAHASQEDISIIAEAVKLNGSLVKLPDATTDKSVEVRYNLMEFYASTQRGEEADISKIDTTIQIRRSEESWPDFQTWCREVVWWGNKKGAYLYTNQVNDRQLAGHY